MHPRKNTIRLLQAYDEYLNRQPEGLDLVIAGRLAWNSGTIADVLKQMKHADRVRRIGHLGAQELAESIGAARAVVYPSLFEGFGIPVLEGMQSGVPVITSNLSSMPEVAGDAALLVDPYNTQDIADAMQKLDGDARIHADLVERGLQRATHFSWDRSAEKLWESFETMVRGL
jgi:glycosyltransferase involved in cell wall biosynthesis